MDYEFILDIESHIHKVNVIGEHFAIGRFLNTEFAQVEKPVERLNDLINTLELSDRGLLEFTEWCIEVELDELTIFHTSQLDAKSEQDLTIELEQGLSDIDWEFRAQCGKADLIELLIAWVDFREK